MQPSPWIDAYFAKNGTYPLREDLLTFWGKKQRRSHRSRKIELVRVKKVIDVTRSSQAGTYSGIPILVDQLLRVAVQEGFIPAIWHNGKLVPVEVRQGNIVFDRKYWRRSPFRYSLEKFFSRLSRYPFSLKAIFLIFSIPGLPQLGRLVRRLAGRALGESARVAINLDHMELFLPEIPERANSERLRLVCESGRDLKLKILVHDLLPLTHAYAFESNAVVDHASYLGLMEFAEVLHVGSEVLASQLSSSLLAITQKPPRVLVTPLPVPAPKQVAAEKSTESLPQLLFIGAFQARKNLAQLIEALDGPLKNAELTLRIVGAPNPTTKSELELAKRVSRMNAVDVLGRLSRNELERELENCDCVVYLSAAEGYGLPVLEALSHNKPVICANTPINQHFQVLYGGLTLINHKYGFFDDQELRSKTEQLLASRNGTPGVHRKLPQDYRAWAQALVVREERN